MKLTIIQMKNLIIYKKAKIIIKVIQKIMENKITKILYIFKNQSTIEILKISKIVIKMKNFYILMKIVYL